MGMQGADPDGAPGRDETPEERADRNWAEILQELRAVQTGTQILTGFLLAIAFQPVFAELAMPERLGYLSLVVGAGVATLLAMAPVIMHRLLFRRRQKERLVRAGSRILIALLAVVSLLVSGALDPAHRRCRAAAQSSPSRLISPGSASPTSSGPPIRGGPLGTCDGVTARGNAEGEPIPRLPFSYAVPPEGFEPPTFGTGNQRSIP